ncbi:acyl-CoA dehydrogenase family protein [Streptomyces sp. NPDC127072]|uniref:acyl-CoA dehydrogenase family protein n=1 Tax=Streptomyces sp. NPDC127072 TaxID=3347129 RepID=UPI00365AA6A4
MTYADVDHQGRPVGGGTGAGEADAPDTGTRDTGAPDPGTQGIGAHGTGVRDTGVGDAGVRGPVAGGTHGRGAVACDTHGRGPVARDATAPAQLRLTRTPPPPVRHPPVRGSASADASASTYASGISSTSLLTAGDEVSARHPSPDPALRPSLDPARRLSLPHPGGELLATGPHVTRATDEALTWARLATAAQALGVGLALLDRTVEYVKRRTQFGVPVGSFQAVKHRLADAKVALEFARPLLFGAALSMDPADVAAAKVTAGEAAYATARTALQAHGAIGYTAEYDLSLWLTKARALRTAWGSPAECRAEVLAARTAAGLRA